MQRNQGIGIRLKKGIITTIMESLHDRCEREKEHSCSVRDMCHRLGVGMDLSEEELNRLQRAAYMHDIGKITLKVICWRSRSCCMRSMNYSSNIQLSGDVGRQWVSERIARQADSIDPHILKVFIHMMDERSNGEVDWSKELGWTTT